MKTSDDDNKSNEGTEKVLALRNRKIDCVGCHVTDSIVKKINKAICFPIIEVLEKFDNETYLIRPNKQNYLNRRTSNLKCILNPNNVFEFHQCIANSNFL
jgi:hypothetical protein